MLRARYSLVAILLTGCLGVPVATPGGRARIAVGPTVGATGRADHAISLHAGVTPLVWLPERREWDLELGYTVDLFPDHQRLNVQGGYVGLSYMPTLWADPGEPILVRGVATIEAEAMARGDVPVPGATLSIGCEVYGVQAGDGVSGNLYGGVAGMLSGEWSVGLLVQGSYRHLDGEPYGVIGAALSIRFPAALGVVYATPLGLLEGAAVAAGSSTPPPPTDSYSEWREASPPGPSPPPPRPARFECRDADHNVTQGDTLEDARSLCPGCVCRAIDPLNGGSGS